MKVVFDHYACPSCGGNIFEVRHEPTDFAKERGYANEAGYIDFFYGHCECGYNLNLSMAILHEFGEQDSSSGRWSGPYPCLALERAYAEQEQDPLDPSRTNVVICYDYECARSRRRSAFKPKQEEQE